jgi:NAD(P)-dependent dehydrogenase (short-subunit alcohol dehydrogenase family)
MRRVSRFDGKVLFATGAGSGLGEAVAHRFTAEGGRVAVDDRAGADGVAAELDGAIGIETDVLDEDAVRNAVERTRTELGRIDCVLNAAGYAEFHSVEQWPLENFNRLLGVHLGGTFLVCKHAAPALRESGGGSIVNVSSIGARFGYQGNHAYAAAKGGIISFSRVLALELAPAVRVNVISPGTFLTAMTVPLYTAMGEGDESLGLRRAGALSPLGRVGDPAEFAGAACFLFSDDASYVSGAVLAVDGGCSVIQQPPHEMP